MDDPEAAAAMMLHSIALFTVPLIAMFASRFQLFQGLQSFQFVLFQNNDLSDDVEMLGNKAKFIRVSSEYLDDSIVCAFVAVVVVGLKIVQNVRIAIREELGPSAHSQKRD